MLDNKRLQIKTIKDYIIDIRSVYIDIDYEDLDIFYSPQLKRIVIDIRRLKDEANIRERNSIIKDVLLRLLS